MLHCGSKHECGTQKQHPIFLNRNINTRFYTQSDTGSSLVPNLEFRKEGYNPQTQTLSKRITLAPNRQCIIMHTPTHPHATPWPTYRSFPGLLNARRWPVLAIVLLVQATCIAQIVAIAIGAPLTGVGSATVDTFTLELVHRIEIRAGRQHRTGRALCLEIGRHTLVVQPKLVVRRFVGKLAEGVHNRGSIEAGHVLQ